MTRCGRRRERDGTAGKRVAVVKRPGFHHVVVRARLRAEGVDRRSGAVVAGVHRDAALATEVAAARDHLECHRVTGHGVAVLIGHFDDEGLWQRGADFAALVVAAHLTEGLGHVCHSRGLEVHRRAGQVGRGSVDGVVVDAHLRAQGQGYAGGSVRAGGHVRLRGSSDIATAGNNGEVDLVTGNRVVILIRHFHHERSRQRFTHGSGLPVAAHLQQFGRFAGRGAGLEDDRASAQRISVVTGRGFNLVVVRPRGRAQRQRHLRQPVPVRGHVHLGFAVDVSSASRNLEVHRLAGNAVAVLVHHLGDERLVEGQTHRPRLVVTTHFHQAGRFIRRGRSLEFVRRAVQRCAVTRGRCPHHLAVGAGGCAEREGGLGDSLSVRGHTDRGLPVEIPAARLDLELHGVIFDWIAENVRHFHAEWLGQRGAHFGRLAVARNVHQFAGDALGGGRLENDRRAVQRRASRGRACANLVHHTGSGAHRVRHLGPTVGVGVHRFLRSAVDRAVAFDYLEEHGVVRLRVPVDVADLHDKRLIQRQTHRSFLIVAADVLQRIRLARLGAFFERVRRAIQMLTFPVRGRLYHVVVSSCNCT